MERGLLYSIIFHIVFLTILFFGLPSFHRTTHKEIVISLDLLPVEVKSNVKPTTSAAASKSDNKKNNSAAAQAAASPAPEKEKIDKKTEEKKPAENKLEKKIDKKIDKKPEEKKIEKKPEKKPEKKVPTRQHKQEDKKKIESEKLLTNINKKSESKTKKEKKVQKEDTKDLLDNELEEFNKSSKFEDNKPLTLSEIDSIKNQIYKCWNVPAGARDIKNAKVVVQINLQPDGSVSGAKLLDEGKMTMDSTVFSILGESAVRAVYKCSPLQNLPISKYKRWKELELLFDPSQMID